MPGSNHDPARRANRYVHNLLGRLKLPSDAHMARAEAATLICRALAVPATGRSPKRDMPTEARDQNRGPCTALGTRSALGYGEDP